MLRDVEFYQDHLDRVSRSFAFCIRQLPDPLRGWIALSYLTCRILDTIEDSPWPTRAEQMEAFRIFDEALADSARVGAVAALARKIPQSIEPAELALMNDIETIFHDIHALPAGVQQIVRDLVGSMSPGMQHFCAANPDGILRLKTLNEVNAYCFFVAGVVGELLAKLLAKFDTSFELSQLSILRAHHFGLFLQKVNLLKDQVGDEKVGRHLIPSRTLVEDSARENAENAFRFLEELPAAQSEFRRFCAWSLFLGLESLVVARDSVNGGRVLKIARSRAEEIISQIEEALDQSGALERLFQEAIAKLGWANDGKTKSNGPVPEWLLTLYKGPLTSQNLSDLMA
jgi:phytoene/squalene synthetase